MKGKYISFLILPLILFAFFLVLFPAQVVSATSGDANITICHHNNGVKGFVSNTVDAASILSPGHGDHAQDIIPPFVYSNWEVIGTHLVCPNNYSPSYSTWPATCPGRCYKESQPFNSSKCVDKVSENVYGFVNHNYSGLNWNTAGQSILSNSCVVPAEGTCPSTCGYAGGTVPDGDGGLKTCSATNSCSTYRWCSPDTTSITGYRARAISISLPTPDDGGKPWESGKMINQYCAYTPEGTCPEECGYAGGDQVADGNGGYKTCPATNSCSTHRWCVLQEDEESYLAQAISDSAENPEGKPWVTGMDRYCEYEYEQCSVTTPTYSEWSEWFVNNEDESILVRTRTITSYDSVDTTYQCEVEGDKETMERPLCESDGATYADDPLCVAEDDGDVLGVTDVVTADTAGGLDSSAYILQFVLVLITSVLFVSVGKEYLKK